MNANGTDRQPRVVQCCVGRFHHFDLARELHRRGAEVSVFTGYPRWKLRSTGFPMSQVRSYPWMQLAYLGKNRLRVPGRWLEDQLSWWAHQSIDEYAARNLKPCDVFVGLSGSGLAAGRRAQENGAVYVCDRGSTHKREQNEILESEHKRWNVPFNGIDPRSIEKEEREYESADVITVPSRFAAKSFRDRGVPQHKLRVIPYGVELEHFRPVGAPDPDAFEIVVAGQVSFRKGVPYVLEAFQKLKHPHKKLVFAGLAEESMRDWLSESKLDAVEFVGHQSREDLVRLYSKSHVMVLASVEDGFGLVLAQAMACGCPCVATQSSGGPDLITDGVDGFVVPPRDADAICDRLERLSQDSDLRSRMSAAALERVRQMGGWSEYGDRWMNLCRELAGGGLATCW